MRKILIAYLVLFLLTGCEVQKPALKNTSDKPVSKPSDLLPEISQFLDEHKEFGTAIRTETMPDWAKGKRQRVAFDSGKNLLFYTKDNKVVTVYEDGLNGRTIIWGKTE